MTNRERFLSVLNFKKPTDRLPVIEWADWWLETINRWHKEGLSKDLSIPYGVSDYLGLDKLRQMWLVATTDKTPLHLDSHDCYHLVIKNEADYDNIKHTLYSLDNINTNILKSWAKEQKEGNIAVWITLEGFFWFPRRLFGVTEHFLAFYDYPDLMKRICDDLLEYNLKVFDLVSDYLIPDFMSVAEDMSYNHGAMCSKSQFDEFIAPYYSKLMPVIKSKGTIPFVDSDGDVTDLISWMMEVGVEGFLPLERMAGVDISKLRELYPTLKMIGAFDKTIMHLGEEVIRKEFERLMPVMKQGGYIPSCDHQTPPQVSMGDYYLYMKLLKEYCEKAVK